MIFLWKFIGKHGSDEMAKLCKENRTAGWLFDNKGEPESTVVVTGIIFGAAAIAVYFDIQEIVKLVIAPKVWLLEYAKDILSKKC